MFRCKEGCKAKCCGIIPIPRQTYRKHKKKILSFNIDTIHVLKDEVLVITRNGMCGFLVGGKCRIYANRPLVCKLYGIDPKLPCPYIRSDGTERGIPEIKTTLDKINAMVDTAILKYKMV